MERPKQDTSDAGPQPIRHVGVCLDCSPVGDRIVPHGVAMARAFGAKLTVLHALEPPHEGPKATPTVCVLIIRPVAQHIRTGRAFEDVQGHGVPVNKVISARSHLRRPASDGRVDGKTARDARSFDSRCGCCVPLSVGWWLVRWQGEEREASWCSGSALVSVVETTDLGLGHDLPLARRLNLARPGGVAVERLVGPRVVVIREVLT